MTGRPLNVRNPFLLGLELSLGALSAYVLFRAVVSARDVLVLVLFAAFLAIGLNPAVDWLERHALRRALAVLIVVLVALGLFAGFLFLIVPPLVTQTTTFLHNAPSDLAKMRQGHGLIARLDGRYHLINHLQSAFGSQAGKLGGQLTTGIFGVGTAVLSATVSTITVLVLTIFLLANMPRLQRGAYRLVPASRRARVTVLGDEILRKVGGYVLGKLAVALIAGVLEYVLLVILHVPYPGALAVLTSVLDLIPLVGAYIAAAVVALVALTVSPLVAIITIVFHLVYRLLEDYVITPRVMRRAVKVSSLATVLSVILGGVLLGFVGALIAIPVAAALQLIVREVALPRLEDL